MGQSALGGQPVVSGCLIHTLTPFDHWFLAFFDIFIEGGDRNLGHPLMSEHVHFHHATPQTF